MPEQVILVAEDEDQVRMLIARLLEKRGFRVLQAVNGRDALALARQHIDDLTLVVTDMVMPEMGGAPLLRELRKLRSALPVLCITGYTNEEVTGLYNLEGVSCIEKPFTPPELLVRINEMINEAANSSS